MQIEIPGYQTLTINHLLLDYNGTIAEDGRIRDRVRELLIQLSESLTCLLYTSLSCFSMVYTGFKLVIGS